MGNACRSEEQVMENYANNTIDNIVVKDRRAAKAVTRVLLLGTGESGKSTIFKQARELFGKGFEKKEYAQFKTKVYNNIIVQLTQILSARKALEIPFENPNCANLAKKLEAVDIRMVEEITPIMASDLLTLWNDAGVHQTWQRRSQYQVFDCIEYYMRKEVLDRVAAQGKEYVPTFEDIVQCRDRTTGIIVENFKLNGADFQMYDVGGQRSERRKWLSCFDHVTSVIFVVAINEYDQTLFEENSVPRIDEALRVYKDIVNRDDFRHIGFILFFNKYDLFERKVCEFSYKLTKEEALARNERPRNLDYEYQNPMDYREGTPERSQAINQCYEHTRDKFIRVANNPRGGLISSHPTVATDNKNMNIIFQSAQDQILNSYLRARGFADVQ